MQYKDYYDVLGVARNASDNDIKRRYRKLAREYHPDVTDDPEGEEKFKEIGEAYGVLRDQDKRRAYDALGRNWRDGQEFQPPPDWGAPPESYSDARPSDFADLLHSMFGGSNRPSSHSFSEHDQLATIEIPLTDSYEGASRNVLVQIPHYLKNGDVRMVERKLCVSIPRGIRAGQKIRLRGESNGTNALPPAGGLYLTIAFEDEPDLVEVRGQDVTMRLSIAPWQAALGGKILTRTPGGKLTVNVPPNARQGQKLRLRGKGLPGSPAGNLFLQLNITLPVAKTAEQRDAYARLGAAFGADPQPATE